MREYCYTLLLPCFVCITFVFCEHCKNKQTKIDHDSGVPVVAVVLVQIVGGANILQIAKYFC